MTKIGLGGSIAISELVVVILTPFIIPRDINNFRKDGMKTLINLTLLWLLGAVFADFYNQIPLRFAIKGIATPIVYLCLIICCYHILKADIRHFRWFILGCAISYLISTFVFQRATSLGGEVSMDQAIEATVDYKLYWVRFVDEYLLLPIRGWFLATPSLYTLMAAGGITVFSLLQGARSASLAYSISFALLFLGARGKVGKEFIKRHLVLLCIAMLCMMIVVRSGYKYALSKGILGELEQKKYELQTRTGDSALQMLMAGRVAFFVGIYAAWEHPIVGSGSWAFDYEGLYLDFLQKYGEQEDYEYAMKIQDRRSYVSRIPAHSHIVTFWLWHGIGGLIFWIYVIWLVMITGIRYLDVVRELFGYFALAIPIFLWDVLFSPSGNRVSESVLFVLCVLVHKIAKERKFTLNAGERR